MSSGSASNRRLSVTGTHQRLTAAPAWTHPAAAAILLLAAACQGNVTDRGELISLVQRVELTPGVYSLDTLDPTPVGQDWRQITFYFTEPLTAASAAAFDPASHLDLGGLTLDPNNPLAFNEVQEGLIPPYGLLVLNLEVPAIGLMRVGEYRIRLLSPSDHPLETESGGSFLGEYRFRVLVAAKDEKLPYIVRFEAGSDGAPEESEISFWHESEGQIFISEGRNIAPHAPLRVELSERMRTPLPVTGSPTVSVIGRVELSSGHIDVAVDEIPGLDFQPAVEPVKWTDSVDGALHRPATVLTSQTPEGLELGITYFLQFAGNAPLTSTSTAVRDRSGEPLTIRFKNDPEARKSPFNDTRAFTTAPVRIQEPAVHTFVNASDLVSDVTLPVQGELADIVDRIDVSLSAPPATEPSPAGITATRNSSPEISAVGVPIDHFQSTVTLSTTQPDGEYRLFAEAFDAGDTSLGWDVVRVIKDTVAPVVISGGEVEILASDAEVPAFCVSTDLDTILAEVFFEHPTGQQQLLASTTDFLETLVDAPLQLVREFCFDPFDHPAGLVAGENEWTIRLTDEAGNSSETKKSILVRPVIHSIQQDAEPGDLITITGYGLGGLTTADGAIFNGGFVSLDHTVKADNSGGAKILNDVITFHETVRSLVMVRLRIPEFVASGSFSFSLAGTTSTSKLMVICTPPVGPFIADGLADLAVVDDPADPLVLLETAPYVAGITSGALTKVYEKVNTGPFPVFRRVFHPAGMPIVAFLNRELGVVQVAEWNGKEWKSTEVHTATRGTLLPAVAAARPNKGDAVVAFVAQGSLGNSIYLARREPETCASSGCEGTPSWTTQEVISAGPFFDTPPTSLALTFAPDGRAGLAYVVQNGISSPMTLFGAIETAPGSSVFRTVEIASQSLADPEDPAAGALVPGAAVSAVFDPQGRMYVAYNQMFQDVTPELIASLDPRFFGIGFSRIVSTPSGLTSSELRSPGRGFWPSVAINPQDSRPSISFQRVSSAFSDPASGNLPSAVVVVAGRLFFSTFNGVDWVDREQVENLPPQTAFRTGANLTIDPNLTVPRSILRFTREGKARLAYIRPAATVVLATRVSAGVWETPAAAISNRVSAGFDFVLDPAGEARLVYDDVGTGRAEGSSLRLIREDDARAADPSLDAENCNSDEFQRRVFHPTLTHFIEENDRHPFSVEWLTALPDYAVLTSSEHPNFPSVLEESRKLFVTALTGSGSNSAGIQANSTYTIESSDLDVSFSILMPQLRGSGERELTRLSAVIEYVALDEPLKGQFAPLVSTFTGRVRGTNKSFHVRTEARLLSAPEVFVTCTGRFGPLGIPAPFPIADCNLTEGDVAAFEDEGFRLFALAITLAPFPPTRGMGGDRVEVESVVVDLHGVDLTHSPAQGAAGEIGFDFRIPFLNVDAAYVSGGDICTTVGFELNGHTDQRLRIGGPIFTTARNTGSGIDPMVGQLKLNTVARFVPALNLEFDDPTIINPLDCGFIVEELGPFLGIDTSSADDSLSSEFNPDLFRTMIATPAVERALQAVDAQDAWTIAVTPAGSLNAVGPP